MRNILVIGAKFKDYDKFVDDLVTRKIPQMYYFERTDYSIVIKSKFMDVCKYTYVFAEVYMRGTIADEIILLPGCNALQDWPDIVKQIHMRRLNPKMRITDNANTGLFNGNESSEKSMEPNLPD